MDSFDDGARERRPSRRGASRAVATAAVAAAALIGAFAATRPLPLPVADRLAADRLRAHLGFLSDDLLEGRFTGSPGYEIAARYVAAQLSQLGLRPLAGDSYLLPVPLVAASLDVPSARFEIVAAGRRQPLLWKEEFVTSGDPLREHSEVEAPVVFVSYGVVAPDLGWDDYAGLDVRGKVVLVMRGAPARFPHDQRAYHSATEVKRAVAVSHGAIGYLSCRSAEDAARTPWEKVARNAGRLASMAWLETDGRAHGEHPELLAGAYLSERGLEALLAAAGRKLADVEAAAGSPRRGFPLGVAVHVAYDSTRRHLSSSNVAALLPGTDPSLAGEVVVLSAHLDHLGRGAAVAGDDIYNGFYDNAMGSALLLETARALALEGQRPRRSLVFLAVTGEERGLLGSEHFAVNPPTGLGRLVADVNLDMPLFLHPVSDVVAFGAEHSTLEGPAAKAARAAGFVLSPDPIPEEVVFVRSDQYSFVARGIPSVFFVPGFGSRDPSVAGEAAFRGFLDRHYHQPSDEISLPVDWPSALRFLQANVLLTEEIANAPEAPTWKAGDFFGVTFGGGVPAAPVAPPIRHLQR